MIFNSPKAFFNLFAFFLILSCQLLSVQAVTKDGKLDPNFIVNPITLSSGGVIYDLEQMPDGKLLVGGTFSVISGAPKILHA